MTWPSFLAASIRAGVTASAGGASAITRVASAEPASHPPATFSACLREIPVFFISSLIWSMGRIERLGWPYFIPPAKVKSMAGLKASFASKDGADKARKIKGQRERRSEALRSADKEMTGRKSAAGSALTRALVLVFLAAQAFVST